MQEYEYKVEEMLYSSMMEEELNEYAKKGWRCIQISRSWEKDYLIAIFERKL